MAAMKKLCSLVALCVAVSALAVAGVADEHAPTFAIEGRVYCDNCRAGFETSVTEYVEGAKVRLECRHEETGEVSHRVEGVTDGSGTYKLVALDDHQDEICEVVLVGSPNADCSEIKDGRDRARVLLTHNAGMSNNVRFANSLGFLKTEPLPICGSLLKQYQLGDEE